MNSERPSRDRSGLHAVAGDTASPAAAPGDDDLVPAFLSFLCGELDDEEVEKIELRAITEPEFFDRLEAAEADVLDAWARGELPPSQARQLESLFGATAGGRERLAFATALRQHLESSEAAAVASGLLPFSTSRPGSPATALRPGLVTWGALAASLVLAIACLWLLASRGELARQLAERPPEVARLSPANDPSAGTAAVTGGEGREADLGEAATRAELDALSEALEEARLEGKRAADEVARQEAELAELRGALEQARDAQTASSEAGRIPFVLTFAATVRSLEGPSELRLSPGDRVVALTVDLGDDHGYDSYRAALRTARGGEVWSASALAEEESEWGRTVTLDVPAERLGSGEYELILLGRRGGAAEEVGFYPFRIERSTGEGG